MLKRNKTLQRETTNSKAAKPEPKKDQENEATKVKVNQTMMCEQSTMVLTDKTNNQTKVQIKS